MTSQPQGIDCGADCRKLFLEGTVVTLSATPFAGGEFEAWSGDLDCEDGEVTMFAKKSCDAVFACPQGSDLTVSDVTISGAETFETCGQIVVGPSVVIESGADATLRAGERVVLKAPVAIQSGASLTVWASP